MEMSITDIEKFLSANLGTPATDIQAINQGEWSKAYYFSASGKDFVARFSKTNEDFAKDRYAYRFSTPKLIIPQIQKMGVAFGGYFAISEKIDGTMIDHLDSTQIAILSPNLIQLFENLRSIDISTTSGYGNWDESGNGSHPSWKSFLSSVTVEDPTGRVTGITALAQYPYASIAFDRALQAMLGVIDICPEDRHVIHGDLMHLNLLSKGGRIAGVLDWGCSIYGDFLYDLAMFELWKFYYPAMEDNDFAGKAKEMFVSRGANLEYFEERLRCYKLHQAMDAIKYNAFKNNESGLQQIVKRVYEFL